MYVPTSQPISRLMPLNQALTRESSNRSRLSRRQVHRLRSSSVYLVHVRSTTTTRARFVSCQRDWTHHSHIRQCYSCRVAEHSRSCILSIVNQSDVFLLSWHRSFNAISDWWNGIKNKPSEPSLAVSDVVQTGVCLAPALGCEGVLVVSSAPS